MKLQHFIQYMEYCYKNESLLLMKILFSNIGYAKGISGKLWEHVSLMHRHFYCNISTQKKSMAKLKAIITAEKPDICCLVEIHNGAFHSGYYRQIEALVDDEYRFFDVKDKYGDNRILNHVPLHKERGNGFVANKEYKFERLYFKNGTKKLIYKIELPNSISLYFAHFSLLKKTREKQFLELQQMLTNEVNDVIIMGDFNIMKGFSELQPLLHSSKLHLLNNDTEHTFTFHKQRKILDLCLCSKRLKDRAKLKVIAQDFSDHSALLLEF